MLIERKPMETGQGRAKWKYGIQHMGQETLNTSQLPELQTQLHILLAKVYKKWPSFSVTTQISVNTS